MTARVVIGLTGNIASGKSVVAHMLTALGAEVIDADRVAHEVMAVGTPETHAIEERFGPGVLTPDGAVDRVALGRIVFSDRAALADLEAIVHPGVRRRIDERLRESSASVVVVEAIKLLEGPLAQRVDTVWVVTAPREVRAHRLVAERGLTLEEAWRRIDAQNPEEDKVRMADTVLDNAGSLDDLRRQVVEAWESISATSAP